MIRVLLAFVFAVAALPLYAQSLRSDILIVRIPYMERESAHRAYADELLRLALELSKDKYGPYRIIQQRQETVIRRQLLEVETGKNLSLAVSMPTPEWLEKTQIIQVPIMKGLASYRLFLANKNNKPKFKKITRLSELKTLTIGQGQGWSTAKILEDNGFDVMHGGPYPTLIPMLKANRFELLMRSIYEAGPELKAYQHAMPELVIVNEFGLYTYLPMYFFVSKNEPLLAERLTYGLHKAHNNGQLTRLFKHHFSDALELLRNKQRKTFFIPNTNIEKTFFEQDRPYLLKEIIELENRSRSNLKRTTE